MFILPLFLCFLPFFQFRTALYIQSNATISQDGHTPQNPLNDLSFAMDLLLNQSGGSIILLPSSLNYWINSTNFTQNLSISGFQDFPIELDLNGSLMIFEGIEMRFEWLLIKIMLSDPTIQSLITLSLGSTFVFYSSSLVDYSKNADYPIFIQGNKCFVNFTNILITRIKLHAKDPFIYVANSSFLFLDSCNFTNLTILWMDFIGISNSILKIKNSFIEKLVIDWFPSYFLGSTSSNFSFFNCTFSNLTETMLFDIKTNSPLRVFITFIQCYFNQIIGNYFMIVFYLNSIIANITFDEVYFNRNIVTYDGGCFIGVENGDFLNIKFSNIVFYNNFGIFLQTLYAHSLFFQNFYVRNHNVLDISFKKPYEPKYFSYIESTVYMNFEKFIINGSLSTKYVAGIKIHINNFIYARGTMDYVIASSIQVNFTDCAFIGTNSIDGYWLDKGSAMAFHSDLPINSNFLRVFIIDNTNDLGSTCLESYGQGMLKWSIIDSFFINNTANAGSPCLSIYVLSLLVENSTFLENSLIDVKGNVAEIEEGTKGGVIYGETDKIVIHGCNFYNNTAFAGGVFYFYVQWIKLTQLKVSDSRFWGNKAKLGGVFCITNLYFKIDFQMNNSKFEENTGFNGGCFYLAFNSPNSLITVSNNTFTKNNALKGGVSFLSLEGFSAFFINNLFISNLAWNFNTLHVLSYGGVSYLSEEAPTLLININNKYRNNTSYNSGGVHSVNRGFLNETLGDFMNSFAYNQAGSIFLRNSAFCVIFFSSFVNESTNIWGGSFVISENSDLLVSNSSFQYCSAKQGGVFFIENHDNVTILGSLFLTNQAYEGGVALIYSSSKDIEFNNCSFFNHPNQKYLIMASSSLGNLWMQSIFYVANLCSMLSLVNSKLIFEDSKVKINQCSKPTDGCIVYAEESNIELNRVIIEETEINSDGTLFHISNCGNSVFYMVSIKNLTGNCKSCCLQADKSNLGFENCSFYITGYGCLFISNTAGSIKYTTFDNFYNDLIIDNGNFINLENSYNFTINFGYFLNNNRQSLINGAAIKSSNSQDGSLLIVNNSIFSNNSANSMGGGIYLENQNFIIMSCLFFNNSADFGGALYFIGKFGGINIVSGNTFAFNFGNLQGGAINFYYDLIELINNNVYKENSAFYGPDIAAFPIFFRLKIYNNSGKNSIGQIFFNESFLIFDSFTRNFTELVIEDFPTGQISQLLLVFELLDFFNQTIKSKSYGLGHIEAVEAKYLNKTMESYSKAEKVNLETQKYDFANKKLSLSGNLDSFNRNGSFYFTDLTIYGTPSSYFNLFISNDLLLDFYPQNSPNFVKINSTIGLLVPVHLKLCSPGELYMNDVNFCFECPFGKYSLNPTDSACLDCPSHATCYGGAMVSIDQGFWRTLDPNAVDIKYCFPQPDACLGGIDNLCENGYEGPLCSVCKKVSIGESFTRIGNYCIPCMSTILNACFILGLLSFYGLVLLIMIKMNLKINPSNFITNSEDRKKEIEKSLIYKILVDHIQFLGINQNLGFTFPNYLSFLNSFISAGVYFADQLFSFDCFIKFSNQQFQLRHSLIFIRSACVALLPVFSILIIILVWGIYCFWLFYFKKTKPNMAKTISHIIASIIVALFFVQPTILNSMSRLFGCVVLGNESYVLSDMSLKCWDSEHQSMIYIFAIPSLIIWNAGVPLFCLAKINKNRKTLKNEDIVLKYGFLYNGFDEHTYYWGFLKYYLKAFIILLQMTQIETGVKILTAVMIWILILIFNCLYSVYVHKILNYLEFSSNFVNFITLFLSLYGVLGVGGNGKSIVFIMIISFNCFFFVFWVLCFIKSTKKMIELSIRRFFSSIDTFRKKARFAKINVLGSTRN